MNSNSNTDYNPADDGNQGVVQLLSQAEEANAGVSQAVYMNPVTAQGPESEKAEVNDDGPSDGATNGINDDMLDEEDVEDGDLSEEEE